MRSVLAAAALLLWANAAQAMDAQSVFARAAGNVLALEALDDAGKSVGGFSAVALGRDRLVTRCEAVEGASALRIQSKGGAVVAKAGKRDTVRGLCLVQADLGPAVAPLAVAADLPAVGSSVFAISHVDGVGITLSSGVVSGVRRSEDDIAIQFTASISPGASGAGLFDSEGRLVGIIDYRHRDGQNVNFAQPASWIGQIEARAASQELLSQTRDTVSKLGLQRKWSEVEPLARAWTGAMPRDRDAWTWLGTAQWGLKRFEDAEKSFERASHLGEVRDDIVSSLFFMQVEQNKLEAAANTLRAALAERKESPTLWLLMGRLQHAAGKLDDARTSYERVIELFPWSREAHEGLAEIARAKGDLGAYIFSHRQLAHLDPSAWRPWLVLARDYLAAGMVPRASAAVARAQSLVEQIHNAPYADSKEKEEGMGEVLYYSGLVAAAEGRRGDAIAHYQASLKRKPASAANVWTSMGDNYYQLRLFNQAIAAYREALRLQPSLKRARQWLIVALKDSGQAAEALPLLEVMRKENPKDDFVWSQLGFAYAVLARHDVSIAALRESLKLEPKQPKIWAAIALQATLANRKAEALSAYETLRGMDAKWADSTYQESVRFWDLQQ